MGRHADFLAGDRPEDVLVYLPAETVSNAEALEGYAETVEDGHVLVLPGERAREVFGDVAGVDPMTFARRAGQTDGEIAADLTGGSCPAGPGPDHGLRLLFAFVEAENPDAGGRYAEGDVLHAYAACACGETYSARWVVGERAAGG